MKNKKLFYINMIYYIAMTLVATVFVLGFYGVLDNEWITSILLQVIIICAIPILMYTILVSKNLKKTFSDFGFKKLSNKLILLSICIALVLYLLNIFIANCFNSVVIIFGYETTIPTLTISNASMLKEFFLTACLPGLCEEVIHRGMMLNGCKKQGFTRYGLIFSSILFGLLHLNILQFFYAAILGFCMGLSVLATGSIWTGVIIHFTNNFLSIYFSLDRKLPLHGVYEFLMNKLISLDPMSLIITIFLIILALSGIFIFILKKIQTIKASLLATKLAEELNLNNLTEQEATEKINQLNDLLMKIKPSTLKTITNENKSNFTDNIFLISSLCLGSLATIFSFITGIL